MCALHAHLAQWKETIEWRDKAVANGDRTVWPLAELASANAWLSNLKEAKEAAAQAQNIYPGFLCRPYWVGITATIRPSTLKRIAEGLRKAALPDGDKRRIERGRRIPRLSARLARARAVRYSALGARTLRREEAPRGRGTSRES